MLNSYGFDLWADEYDKSVSQSQQQQTYPFAGYRDVLNYIYIQIRRRKGKKILDLGFGTALLAQRLYQDGYQIFGVDFSPRMLEIARGKMPGARLELWDFSRGLPPAFAGEQFDFILCTYAIHHLDTLQKVELLTALRSCLSDTGLLLVGDVAFATGAQQEGCRRQNLAAWDEEEIYPVVEELAPFLPGLQFEQSGFCAGVLSMGKN